MSIKNQWGDVKIMNPAVEAGDVVLTDICPSCIFEKDLFNNLDSKDMFT